MILQKKISWNDLSPNDLLFYSILKPDFIKYSFKLVQRNSEALKKFKIGDQFYNIQLPITFTPYAAAQPCSARCWFCSENLRFEDHIASNSLVMIEEYHHHLDQALGELIKIPLGLSLSGLEFSDVLDWALKTIDCLINWQDQGGQWTEKALYSNLAGFANASNRINLITHLKMLELDRLEVSRHHYDEYKNKEIMLFRKNQDISKNNIFIETLNDLHKEFPTRLVCILQKDGISNLNEVYQYLNWANTLGIRYIIFRELSDITDDRYKPNNTYKKIKFNKISVEKILFEILSALDKSLWKPVQIETGYYYWNCMWETPWGTVVFERSDYGFMKQAHESQAIHKLVFHPNGNLSSDWTPNINVLIEYAHASK